MTKNCIDGILIMGDGVIRFEKKNNPHLILAFSCKDEETFNAINSFENFLREQSHFEELSQAKSDAENYICLYQQAIK